MNIYEKKASNSFEVIVESWMVQQFVLVETSAFINFAEK
jgi:hypothetical protein